ncbi:hypothetical protein ONZ45_g18824 [Pleurotus djamor]|nr:hypothetical protein ONZ45_g18824 [Pleurotus djamor]
MLPDLPAEIWLRIVSYIPPKELNKLYPLNHLFREIVENHRYDNLSLRCFTNDTVRMLKNSRFPGVAQRVHSLEIHLRAFVRLAEFDEMHPRWQTNLQSAFMSLRWIIDHANRRDPLAVTSKTIPQITDYLLTAAQEMVNIHSCHFALLPGRALESYVAFLRRLWSILSPRVHRLTIEAPGSGLHLLPSVFCHLHRLEHLSISLHSNPNRWTKEYVASLTTFLNNASETLHSLTLTSSPSTPIPEYRFLFEQLNRFKRLKRFNLDIPFDGVVGPSVIQFLNKHADTVKEVSLNPDTSEDSHIIPLSRLDIPELQKLSVSFSYHSSIQLDKFWEGTLHFTVLRDLTIIGPYLIQPDLALIFSAIKRSESGKMLDTLKLDVWVLTGPTFDSLVEAFPALRILSIRSTFLSHGCESHTWEIKHFAEEMATRHYLRWGLYDITLSQHDQSIQKCPQYTEFLWLWKQREGKRYLAIS